MTYLAPTGVPASTLYQVQLSQGAITAPSFVYMVQNQWPSISTELTTSWTSFNLGDPVTVQVQLSLPVAQALITPEVRVLPSHAGITANLKELRRGVYTATFTVSKPGQYAVDFFDADKDPHDGAVPLNPMLIFANAPGLNPPYGSGDRVYYLSPGKPIPASIPAGYNILYFSPGVYDLTQLHTTTNASGESIPLPYTLSSNQTIYIAGGAYVKGAFYGDNVENVHIEGHGILSGEGFTRNGAQSVPLSGSVQNGTPPMIYVQGASSNIRVDGLTLIQSPFYNIELAGSKNVVDNVKAIAWYGSTDGIQVAYDTIKNGVQVPGEGVIENSFFKVGDDSIKLLSTGLNVTGCTVWKLNNAAAFEFGANVTFDLSNITVSNCDVIRTEYDFPGSTNAIFASNYGGPAHLSGYHFNDIRVENAEWQLFQMVIKPNTYLAGNTELGFISNVNFNNIQVTDQQSHPDLFQSYNRQHSISGVSFTNVLVGGRTYTTSPSPAGSSLQPCYSYNANRTMSLTADVVADPLWRYQQSDSFQIWQMNLGGPESTPQYYPVSLTQPAMTPDCQIVGIGDFYGDGLARVLVENTTLRNLQLWDAADNTAPVSFYHLDPGWNVTGTGDFNGDGVTDILLSNVENSQAPQCMVLLLNGTTVIGKNIFAPNSLGVASDWKVAGVGDIDQNGYSDVLFRDSQGNLKIIYFSAEGAPTDASPLSVRDFKQTTLHYSATSYYQANPDYTHTLPFNGTFDTTWTIAGVRDTAGQGFAKIVWVHPATGDLAIGNFNGLRPQTLGGQLFSQMPPNVQLESFGDYNGDGAIDLLLRDTQSGLTMPLEMGFFGGNLFVPGPLIVPSLPPAWIIKGARGPN